jgi:putative exporter of polyketide antibiotics
MLLGLVIHYVALRSDSLNLPFSVNPAVTYLATMVFLAGLALSLYGLLNRVTA